MKNPKVTLPDIQGAKKTGRKITMLTAYDSPFAQLVDLAGVDMILVGDSLGMVVLGLEGTVAVTMEDMIHHIKAAKRGCQRALLVGDMPFMSYNTSNRDAIINAGRLIKEGGCEAVKLEGGNKFAVTVRAIVDAGIPVQGHIGLTPQTASSLGGFKIQGKDLAGAKKLIEDAKSLEAAGAFSIILEAVPAPVGQLIAETLKIPVIGIGAGPNVDGQVLVTHDLLGLFDKFVPKFVKKYAQIREVILDAMNEYRQDVINGSFPAAENCFTMPSELVAELKKSLGK